MKLMSSFPNDRHKISRGTALSQVRKPVAGDLAHNTTLK
jgi:hypothetical protein